jgi:signal transduction histidine kinase
MDAPTPAPREPDINLLIVDDSPTNLQLLAGLLRQHGFIVRPVLSGELALQAARHEAPDLILLDINMPKMNGFEVCERLKADAGLKDIPVIFVSALDEVIDRIRAFGVGGVDYVTKPFQFEEVEARVRTHVALRRQQRQVTESYNRLAELEGLRDSLVHMIVHDLRSPLMGILGLQELALEDPATQASPILKECLSEAFSASTRLVDMVNSILDVSRLEAGKMPLNLQACGMNEMVRHGIALLAGLTAGREVTVTPWPSDAGVHCDPDLIQRVISNLVGNAIKHTPRTTPIGVTVSTAADSVTVTVRDAGPGIPPEFLPRLFEKFGQADLRAKGRAFSTGLGLAFCELAVKAHGGTISVESQVGHGSTFWFTLPQVGPRLRP